MLRTINRRFFKLSTAAVLLLFASTICTIAMANDGGANNPHSPNSTFGIPCKSTSCRTVRIFSSKDPSTRTVFRPREHHLSLPALSIRPAHYWPMARAAVSRRTAILNFRNSSSAPGSAEGGTCKMAMPNPVSLSSPHKPSASIARNSGAICSSPTASSSQSSMYRSFDRLRVAAGNSGTFAARWSKHISIPTQVVAST